MCNIEVADEIYEEKRAKDPEFPHHLVMKWRSKMQNDYIREMLEIKHGCHIYDEHLYNEATSYFRNKDGSEGPHWKVNAIVARSGIDFGKMKFTKYDYAYIVNMLYSDYGDTISLAVHYLQMAKSYLCDEDYYGDPSERAYHDAMRRIEYFEE